MIAEVSTSNHVFPCSRWTTSLRSARTIESFFPSSTVSKTLIFSHSSRKLPPLRCTVTFNRVFVKPTELYWASARRRQFTVIIIYILPPWMRARLTGAAVNSIHTLNVYLLFAHARLRCAHARATSNISTFPTANSLNFPQVLTIANHGQCTESKNWQHLVFLGVDAAILVFYSQNTIDCATEPTHFNRIQAK